MEIKKFSETTNEEVELFNWSTPFNLQWKYMTNGLWRVVITSENGKKTLVDTMISDSIPNDMKKLKSELNKIVDLVKKMGEK